LEKITNKRKNKDGVWEYYIKWKDYPIEENSWEPGTNILANALKKFWKTQQMTPFRKNEPIWAKKGTSRTKRRQKEKG
jgi:hypothetical protein